MTAKCRVRPSEQVFTVYVGLTASGYDMARPSLGEPLYRLIQAIRGTDWPRQVLAYFAKARTATCKVNPYWPRAFLLTVASLYLPESPPHRFTNPELISEHIEGLEAVSPEDKDAETARWVLELPDAYRALKGSPGIRGLWELYLESMDLCRFEEVAAESASLVKARIGVLSDALPHVVVTPNPLQAPEVTDAVILGDEAFIIEAQPNIGSCVHEMLHHFLAPVVDDTTQEIRQFVRLLGPVRRDMLRLRYAWDDSEESWCRVFEENLMRAAEIWVSCADDPAAIESAAARQASFGFRYVPVLTRHFQSHWSGIDSARDFITQCLHACNEQHG